jgi:FkbM family methyltransferase
VASSNAINAFCGLAKRPLHKLGIDVTRYRPYARAPSPYELRRSRLMVDHCVSLVIDVGAAGGLYALDLRAAGYAGRIVSFEPLSTSYQELEQRAACDPKWQAKCLALGSCDCEGVLNVASNCDSSSLLPMAERHLRAAPFSAYSHQERVAVATLESVAAEFLMPTDCIMLKMDVQGYEKEVLGGAGGVMDRVVLIESELSLCTLYEGQPLFTEVAEYCRQLGFQLVALADEFTEPDQKRVLQVNGLFERTVPLGVLVTHDHEPGNDSSLPVH